MIKSYLWCPKNFQYRYIDEILPTFRSSAALHGTIIHSLISEMHQHNWELNIEERYREVLQYHEFDSEEAVTPVFWKEDRDKVVDKLVSEAVEMLDNYRDKDYNWDAHVILNESTFVLKVGRAGIFRGTVDQIRKHPDGMYELVDFKTSKFAPSQAFLDVDYQFGLYALACADATFKSSDCTLRLLDIPPDRLKITWYHLRDHIPYKRKTKNNQIGDERGDPRRTTKRSDEQIKSLKQDLSKVATNIRRGVFPRNPSYSTCPLCPYVEMCAKDSCGMGLNRNQKSQIQQLVQNLEEAA